MDKRKVGEIFLAGVMALGGKEAARAQTGKPAEVKSGQKSGQTEITKELAPKQDPEIAEIISEFERVDKFVRTDLDKGKPKEKVEADSKKREVTAYREVADVIVRKLDKVSKENLAPEAKKLGVTFELLRKCMDALSAKAIGDGLAAQSAEVGRNSLRIFQIMEAVRPLNRDSLKPPPKLF